MLADKSPNAKQGEHYKKEGPDCEKQVILPPGRQQKGRIVDVPKFRNVS
jgi:hypothetical protein